MLLLALNTAYSLVIINSAWGFTLFTVFQHKVAEVTEEVEGIYTGSSGRENMVIMLRGLNNQRMRPYAILQSLLQVHIFSLHINHALSTYF